MQGSTAPVATAEAAWSVWPEDIRGSGHRSAVQSFCRVQEPRECQAGRDCIIRQVCELLQLENRAWWWWILRIERSRDIIEGVTGNAAGAIGVVCALVVDGNLKVMRLAGRQVSRGDLGSGQAEVRVPCVCLYLERLSSSEVRQRKGETGSIDDHD